MNKTTVEELQIASGFAPVNMTAGANAGDWVNLKNYNRLSIVFFKGIGTAGNDPTITLLQAKTVSAGSSKPLAITRVDKKQGADLTAIDQFTQSTVASPATNDTFNANTWTNSDLAEQQGLIVIDVKPEDLDIDGGFSCVQASIADAGTNTQLGCALYLLRDPKNAADPLPSAIIN